MTFTSTKLRALQPEYKVKPAILFYGGISMKVELTQIKGDYEQVVDRCRTTVSKEGLGKEPGDTFKRKILMAEHSPIRSLIYCFKIIPMKLALFAILFFN